MVIELFVHTILNSSLQTVRIFFRILGIGLELACNGGSCGEPAGEYHLHLKRLPA